jgi:glutaminase
MAGGEDVGFDNSTFLKERNQADRNYSLAYYMRENGCFPEKTDIKQVLEFYCQVRKNSLPFQSHKLCVTSSLAPPSSAPWS